MRREKGERPLKEEQLPLARCNGGTLAVGTPAIERERLRGETRGVHDKSGGDAHGTRATTVVSSCGCSTPTTTNTDFSRSSCLTARAASSPPCFVPPSGRAARRSSRSEALLRAIRAHWPNTEILLRADSHYCGPEVLDWCRANGLDYMSSASRQLRHCAAMSKVSKPARRRVSRPRREIASFVVSWSSTAQS